MRHFLLCALIAFLWLGVRQSEAQTPKIQRDVEKKLEQMRADQKKEDKTKLDQKKQGAAPPSLELWIAEALKNNPDIRVAEAKLHDAEAELQRTRLKVLSEVTLLHTETPAAQAGVEEAGFRYEKLRKLYETNLASIQEVIAAKQAIAKQKTHLAVLQAKLPYLLGKPSKYTAIIVDAFSSDAIPAHLSTRGGSDAAEMVLRLNFYQHELRKGVENLAKVAGKAATDEEFLRRLTLDLLGRPPTADEMKDFLSRPEKIRRQKWVEKLGATQPQLEAVRGYYPKAMALIVRSDSPMTDKLRKALDAPVRLEFHGTSLSVLAHVRNTLLPGVNLVIRAKAIKNEDGVDINLKEPLPLGAFLQYLQDELDVVFVLRDYGIVVVAAGEPLPPGAVTVVDFWKRGKLAEKSSQAKEKK
jgi:hypothetical protein